MTPQEARDAMYTFQPVKNGSLMYKRIKGVEDVFDHSVLLHLYDLDGYSISVCAVEDVVAVTPSEYAAYKERRRQEHDAFEQLLKSHKEGE